MNIERVARWIILSPLDGFSEGNFRNWSRRGDRNKKKRIKVRWARIFVKRMGTQKRISRSCSFVFSNQTFRHRPDPKSTWCPPGSAHGRVPQRKDTKELGITMPKCPTRTERDIMSTQSVDAETPSQQKSSLSNTCWLLIRLLFDM